MRRVKNAFHVTGSGIRVPAVFKRFLITGLLVTTSSLLFASLSLSLAEPLPDPVRALLGGIVAVYAHDD